MKAKEISITEFYTNHFPTEEAATAYFVEKRWGGQMACAYGCADAKIYVVQGTQPYKCSKCRRKFTAKTGTIMEGSHIPIRMWLFAMYLMATSRKGISSIALSKQLGTTQKTAWFMAHRIREACEEADKLKGVVEADEVYIGPKVKSMHLKDRKRWTGRGVANKTPVIGMKERGGRMIGRVVNTTGARSLQRVIGEHVEKETMLMTDEHSSYIGVPKKGYGHGVINHSRGQYVKGNVHTNGIESVWALLRRGLYGTYHHVDKKHLQRYVDEFAFKLSRPYALGFIEDICSNSGSGALQYKYLTR